MHVPSASTATVADPLVPQMPRETAADSMRRSAPGLPSASSMDCVDADPSAYAAMVDANERTESWNTSATVSAAANAIAAARHA